MSCNIESKPFPTSVQLIESDDITIISQHADQDSLVLLDIDNTIIQLSQTLGTPHWFTDFYNKKRSAGLTHIQAMEMTVKIYVEVNKISDAKLVDERIVKVIQALHEASIPILGLTSRDDGLHEATSRQLDAASVSFKLSKLSHHTIKLNIGERSKVQDGIIFTGGQHKGNCLEAFFSTVNWRPKKIIFVDDVLNSLKDVETVITEMEISYIGIRYSAMDSKVKNVNTKIHELQLDHFRETGKLISDEEAFLRLAENEDNAKPTGQRLGLGFK